jgi:hypothetical protein
VSALAPSEVQADSALVWPPSEVMACWLCLEREFLFCDLIWRCGGMEEAKIGLDDSVGHLRSATLARAVGSSGM